MTPDRAAWVCRLDRDTALVPKRVRLTLTLEGREPRMLPLMSLGPAGEIVWDAETDLVFECPVCSTDVVSGATEEWMTGKVFECPQCGAHGKLLT